jgi:hypothetical protein
MSVGSKVWISASRNNYRLGIREDLISVNLQVHMNIVTWKEGT